MLNLTGFGIFLLSVVFLDTVYAIFLLGELIDAKYDGNIKKKAAVSFFFAIFFTTIVVAVAMVVTTLSTGRPMPFSRLVERGGVTYQVGNAAGAEGVFWISSKDGSRIFENVPKKLRKKGMRFISIDGDKIIVVRDEFIPKPLK